MSNLTYDDFMHLAIKNYNRGGDSYFECWSEDDFDDFIAEVEIFTEADALALFRIEVEQSQW